MFQVYQILFAEGESRNGYKGFAKTELLFDADKYEPDFAETFSLAWEVEAESLSGVFDILNTAHHLADKKHESAHSASVGDVIVNTRTGVAHMVAMFGFAPIEFKAVEMV